MSVLPGKVMTNAHPVSDNHQRLCFTLGLWNGKDPILKERLYGLNGSQGELCGYRCDIAD